jgi:hypothetical protein
MSYDDGMNAADVDPHLAFVGNAVGAVRPVRSAIHEVTGDGLDDLVLYYDVDAVLDLDPNQGAGEGDAALGLHFESPDGTQLLVESIFDLGAPVSVFSSTPIDPNAGLRAGLGAEMAIHPNPFNPQTTVSVDMPATGYASVRVFNVRGMLVKTLRSGTMVAGRHDLRWDGRDNDGRPVASGVYFVSFQADQVRMVKRAVLLK